MKGWFGALLVLLIGCGTRVLSHTDLNGMLRQAGGRHDQP